MNIEYYAEDGRIKSLGDNELAHFKYLKKIKVGSGYRYFYTPEEIKSYYQASKAVSNIKNDYADKKVESDYKANKAFYKDMHRDLRNAAKNGIYTETVYSSKNPKGKTRILKGKEREERVKEALKERKKVEKQDERILKTYRAAGLAKNKINRKTEPLLNTAKYVIKGKPKSVAKGKKKVETHLTKKKKKTNWKAGKATIVSEHHITNAGR